MEGTLLAMFAFAVNYALNILPTGRPEMIRPPPPGMVPSIETCGDESESLAV